MIVLVILIFVLALLLTYWKLYREHLNYQNGNRKFPLSWGESLITAVLYLLIVITVIGLIHLIINYQAIPF